MNNKYFNIGMYDYLFFDKTIKKGSEIYLNNKILDLNKNNNYYTCKIQGSNLYEVKISFKDNGEDIDKMSCTCPFAQEGNKCKHMYALLLKLKCNYNLEIIKDEIEIGLTELNQIFKDFDNNYIIFKNTYPKYLNDIENLKKQMNNFQIIYNRIVEDNKENRLNIVVLKNIIDLKTTLYKRLNNFQEYICLKIKNDTHKNREEYQETIIEKNSSSSLFSIFMDILDSLNSAQEERDKEYEEEKQRYRRAIMEQNLFEGKINEDIYDGLDN